MRILQTSDWQLGLTARQAGARAPDLRAARFAAVERIAELAERERVDLVLVAGDTFDRSDVDEEVLVRAVAILDSMAPRRIFVLPGNHDPLCPGGVWERSSWRAHGAHVRLLDRAEAVEVDDRAVLYPCPVTQKRSRRDPTAWIPPREAGDDRLRIGVAHGSLGILPEASNFPIDAARPALSGLDYLALGDWHGLKTGERWAYSGTPEATSFGESDTGSVLLVDLEAQQTPDIVAARVGALRWLDERRELRDATDVEDLERTLGPETAWEDLVARLRLEVSADAESAAALEVRLRRLRDRLEAACFLVDWNLGFRRPEVAEWPPGLGEEMARALHELAQGGRPAPPFRDLSAEPGVAASALGLLRGLLGETEGRS